MFFWIIIFFFAAVNAYKLCSAYLEEILTIGSFYALYLMGFEVNESSLERIPDRCVMVMSHTSIYDFVIASLLYHAYFKRTRNIYFLMKDSFAIHANKVCAKFFPYTTVIPVNNTSQTPQNIVENVVRELRNANHYILAIAPEGTRRPVENIKSGFYHIARNLQIPVVYCGIDFSRKIIQIEAPHAPAPTLDDEKEWFKEMCRKYVPLYPENCLFISDFYQHSSPQSGDEDPQSNIFFEFQNPDRPDDEGILRRPNYRHRSDTDDDTLSTISTQSS